MQLAGTSGRRGGPGATALLAVFVAGAALIAFKVSAAVATGPGWDTYAFLANAAEFAGRGYGYTELHRAPLLSLITAGLYALGLPLRESAIQWVDGALSLSGLIAFYLIARRRFRPLLAAVGALAMLAVQPLWSYLGSGYTDFPSVALSMWLLWASIKATEDDARFYLLVGPLFVSAVMMRYTALLVVFPVVIWVALRWRPFPHAKHIGGGIALGLLAYLPAARFYGERFGDVLFPFILAFGVSESVSAPGGEGTVESSALWYIGKLPEFLAGEPLAILGFVLLLVMLLGLGLSVTAYFQSNPPRPTRLAVALLGCAPALIAQFGGGMILRQLTIPLAVGALARSLAPYEDHPSGRRVTAEAALVAAMVAWLLAYFDFHGHQTIQVPRYVITMTPPLVFLLLHGWQTFVVDIRRTLTRQEDRPGHDRLRPLLRFGAPLSLGACVALILGTTVATTVRTPDPLVVAARHTAEWLRERPRVDDALVFSDLWPLTAWYARIGARPMPFYKDETALQHALDKDAVDYYVTIRGRRFEDFAEATSSGPAIVLERTAAAPDRLPRVAYLGKAWDNYLESVTGYGFYVITDAGRYGWEGTAFLDALGAADLATYDAVAVYGVRWRKRAEGEAALLQYVRSGGSVVIDASSNLGELPYDLGNTVMFDTVIRRASLEPDAQVALSPAFAAAHPEIGSIEASPFRDESGGRWYGADYSALPGTADLTVLATVGGRPAVAMRQVGNGRVYWIGYNLVWHAFITENADEQALIEAVFDDALGSADAP